MNADLLTQFLIDVTRGRLRDAYAADSAGTIAAAPLSSAQRSLVLNTDIAALAESGVHPIVLLTFARLCGWSTERYYACLAEGQTA